MINTDDRRRDALAAFDRLLTTMDTLRAQCPWDQKQTWQTLRHLTIEETYELAEAILVNDSQEVKKETGDLMLHLVFYAKIASETGAWDVADMIETLCDKLVARHPHIYGDVIVSGEEEVRRNWEALKKKEAGQGKPKGVLSGVPSALPAMVKAMRIQEKARGAGFDWDEPAQVWAKVQEELAELVAAGQDLAETKTPETQDDVRDEFGDVLFSLINYARFIGVNPDEALERTNQKFIRRFNFLEAGAEADGKELETMSLAEMDVYWDRAKHQEKAPNM